MDAVLERLIDRDISSLLRDSYEDVFTTLANRHKLRTLTAFDDWPEFVECSQRRNLITHCDGVVSQQYVDKCMAAGVKLPENALIGKALKVPPAYLSRSLDLLFEVGVMLGHTLWRKSMPEMVEASEIELTDLLFDLLTRERWELARSIGYFALHIPNPISDLQLKIIRINYAQALKWSGKTAQAMQALDDINWDGSTRDLRLGVAAIREQWEIAAQLMRDIGKTGELVTEEGYRTWPVFRDFRKQSEFRDAFRAIYGTELADDSSVQSGVEKPTEDRKIPLPTKRKPRKGSANMPSRRPVKK